MPMLLLGNPSNILDIASHCTFDVHQKVLHETLPGMAPFHRWESWLSPACRLSSSFIAHSWGEVQQGATLCASDNVDSIGLLSSYTSLPRVDKDSVVCFLVRKIQQRVVNCSVAACKDGRDGRVGKTCKTMGSFDSFA